MNERYDNTSALVAMAHAHALSKFTEEKKKKKSVKKSVDSLPFMNASECGW